MLFSEKRTPAQRQFLHAVFVPTIITLFFVLVFVLFIVLANASADTTADPNDIKKVEKYILEQKSYEILYIRKFYFTPKFLSFLKNIRQKFKSIFPVF